MEMKRRTFLKMAIQLFTLIVGFRRQWLTAAPAHKVTLEVIPYGNGAYGQGIYQGRYKVYLPLINKEGN
jgi:hypothetical protein